MFTKFIVPRPKKNCSTKIKSYNLKDVDLLNFCCPLSQFIKNFKQFPKKEVHKQQEKICYCQNNLSLPPKNSSSSSSGV